jgi:hypothetical protein
MTNCNNLHVDQRRLFPVRNPHTFGLRRLSSQPDSSPSASNTSRDEFIASVLTQALELGEELQRLLPAALPPAESRSEDLQRLLPAALPTESRSEDISSTRNNLRQETQRENDEDEGKMLQ